MSTTQKKKQEKTQEKPSSTSIMVRAHRMAWKGGFHLLSFPSYTELMGLSMDNLIALHHHGTVPRTFVVANLRSGELLPQLGARWLFLGDRKHVYGDPETVGGVKIELQHVFYADVTGLNIELENILLDGKEYHTDSASTIDDRTGVDSKQHT